jgi:hypothetical protein
VTALFNQDSKAALSVANRERGPQLHATSPTNLIPWKLQASYGRMPDDAVSCTTSTVLY